MMHASTTGPRTGGSGAEAPALRSVSDVERIAEAMFGPATVGVTTPQRRIVDLRLLAPLGTIQGLPLVQEVLACSCSTYAIFLGCKYLRKMLLEVNVVDSTTAASADDCTTSGGEGASYAQWIALKGFLENVIVERHRQGLERFCLNAMIECLSLVVKSGLLDIPAFVEAPSGILSAFHMEGGHMDRSLTRTYGDGGCGDEHSAELNGSGGASATTSGNRMPMDVAPIVPDALALMLLESLVCVVGHVNDRRSLAEHRKTASLFKDKCMNVVFLAATGCLRNVHASIQQQRQQQQHRCSLDPRVVELVVKLMRTVLSFDYLGVVGADSTEEEPPSMNFPNAWRDIFLKPFFFTMFWELFEWLESPTAHEDMLCCINALCCARRSLFQTDEERRGWLNGILGGTLDVMQRGVWLSEPRVRTELCRLLCRIKPNYQLNELLENASYEQWLSTLTDFTCNVFRGWRHTAGGIGYLCRLWARLVGSQQYARKERATFFDVAAPRVVQAYLLSRMEVASFFAEAGDAANATPPATYRSNSQRASASVCTDLEENPLDDATEDLHQQLETMAALLRYTLHTVYHDVASLFRVSASVYASAMGGADASSPSAGTSCGSASSTMSLPSPRAADSKRGASPHPHEAEERLAWLLLLFGSLLKAPCTNDEHYDADAAIISSCFQLIEAMVRRYAEVGAGRAAAAEHVELASLHFLHAFRSVYVGEPTSQASKTLSKLQEKLGFHSVPTNDMQGRLLEFLVSKVTSNLQAWGDASGAVLEETLRLLRELSCGFTSGRQLLDLEAIQYLVSPSGANIFAFQSSAKMYKLRVKYRHTITSLLFLDSTSPQQIAAYMQPMTRVLDCLRAATITSELLQQDEGARDAAFGVLCDIRGVVTACIGRRNFHMLFDVLFPTHLESILLLAEASSGWDDRLETQVLRLSCEIAFNRCQRILFEPHSAGGFHLFFFLSRLIHTLGGRKLERVLQLLTAQGIDVPSGSEVALIVESGGLNACGVHEWLLKGSQLLFNLAHAGLSGAYCNFGVLALYNDDKLLSVLSTVWRLALLFRTDTVVTVPKLARDYFLMLEQIFNLHVGFIANCNPRDVMQILYVVEGSMHAVSLPTAATTASHNCLSGLCKYLLEVGVDGRHTTADGACALEQSIMEWDAVFFERLLVVVLGNCIFNESASLQVLAQSLLPLIQLVGRKGLYPDAILSRLAHIVVGHADGALQVQKLRRWRDALEKLMEGIEPSTTLDRKMRDKFLLNITQFRAASKQLV